MEMAPETLPSEADPIMLFERDLGLFERAPDPERCVIIRGVEERGRLDGVEPFCDGVLTKLPLPTRDLRAGSDDTSSGRDRLLFRDADFEEPEREETN